MSMQAFQSQIFPQGLHLSRCRISTDLGTYEVDPNTTFRAGQLVNLTAAGLVQKAATGLDILGIAKWTKDVGYGYAVAVDEPVVLPGVTVKNLRRGSIAGTNATNNSIKVSLTAGGAALTPGGGGDYVVDSLANGQIHRTAGGLIPDGATVYVTYTYALNSQDMAFQGENFFNKQDDVSIQGNRVAVVQNWALLFSTEYDSSRRYQVGDNLYAGNVDAEELALVTNNVEGDLVGKVIQVPTATDPFLGFEFRNQYV